jgi:hypothetical protein
LEADAQGNRVWLGRYALFDTPHDGTALKNMWSIGLGSVRPAWPQTIWHVYDGDLRAFRPCILGYVREGKMVVDTRIELVTPAMSKE